MTIDRFIESLSADSAPSGIKNNLKALWEDANGNWNTAHNIVQDTSGEDGDWIHAYLHRKEGDLSNASYWYRRAGRSMPDYSLEEEWKNIATTLLERNIK